jgi:hypothetical protein
MAKLYIDDLRPVPDGWVLAKTSAEAIAMLESNPAFEAISFDHDLGGDDTSRAVVLWLCEHEDKWPNTAYVHSFNPVGKEWLTGMINRYGCGVSRNPQFSYSGR